MCACGGEVEGCFPSGGSSLAVAKKLGKPEPRGIRWRGGQEPHGEG